MSCYKVIEDKFIKRDEKNAINGVAGLNGYRYVDKDRLPIAGSSPAGMSGYGVLTMDMFTRFSTGTRYANEMYENWRYIEALERYHGQNVVVLTYDSQKYKAETAMFNGREYPLNGNTCVFDLGEKKTINTTTADERAFMKAVHDILYLPEGITNYDNAFNPGSENLGGFFCTPYVDMSQCTSAKSMFFNQKGLTKLDVSSWDMSRCKDISYMFAVTGIKELDVSKWNTSSLTSISGPFNGCAASSLDVSQWDVSGCTSLRAAFCNHNSQKVDVSRWNTSKVTNMQSMFAIYSSGGTRSTLVGVGNMDTSHVTNFKEMFYCALGKKMDATRCLLDCSGMSMVSATNVDEMFVHDMDASKLYEFKIKLDRNFFNAPLITEFDLANVHWTEELKQSLIDCYDRASAGQPALTLKLQRAKHMHTAELTDAEVAAIEAKGYIVKYNS